MASSQNVIRFLVKGVSRREEDTIEKDNGLQGKNGFQCNLSWALILIMMVVSYLLFGSIYHIKEAAALEEKSDNDYE